MISYDDDDDDDDYDAPYDMYDDDNIDIKKRIYYINSKQIQ